MTVPLSDLVATAAPLRRWLESLPPDAVAGEARHARGCPLAESIVANGFYKAWIGELAVAALISPGAVEQVAYPSRSLVRFVTLVDRSRAKRLTAKHCLALLDRAEREVKG